MAEGHREAVKPPSLGVGGGWGPTPARSWQWVGGPEVEKVMVRRA